MSKKFSTLMASLLLASAFGSVEAQTTWKNYNSYVQAAGVTETNKAKEIVDGRAYHLVASDGRYLVMVQDASGNCYLQFQDATNGGVDLLSSLWTITTRSNSVGGVSFTFMNKAYGLPLAFNSADANKDNNYITDLIRGDVSLWKWEQGTTGAAVQGGKGMVSYISDNVAVRLIELGGFVQAQKYSTAEGATGAAATFTAYEANPVYLNKLALNSMLGVQSWQTGKLKMGFTRDVNKSEVGNLLLNEYTAVDPVANSTSMVDRSVPREDLTDAEDAAVRAALTVWATGDHATLLEQVIKDALNDDALFDALYTNGMLADQDCKKVADGVNYVKGAMEAAKVASATADANKAAADAVKAAVGAFVDKSGTHTAEDFNAYSTGLNFDFGAGLTDFQTNAYKTNGTFNPILKTELDALLNVDATGYNFEEAQATASLKATKIAEVLNIISTTVGNHTSATYSWENIKYDYSAAIDGSTISAEDKSSLKAILDPNVTGPDLIENLVGDGWPAKIAADYKVVANYILSAKAAIDALEAPKDNQGTESAFWAAYGAIEANAAVKEAIKTGAGNWNGFESVKGAVLDAADGYTGLAANAAVKATKYTAAYHAAENYNSGVSAAALFTAIKAANANFTDRQNEIIDDIAASAEGAESLAAGLTAAQIFIQGEYFEPTTEAGDPDWVSLLSTKNTDASKNTYLMLDTTYLTGISGDKHFQFAVKKHKALTENSKGLPVSQEVAKDLNGRYNFKFIYFPSQDSLDITVDGYARKPETVANYVDMTTAQVNESRELDGNKVKLAILANDHREVTVGDPEDVRGTDDWTINTRIYLTGSSSKVRTTLPSGVYFFNLKTNEAARKADNGKYWVAPYADEYDGGDKYEEYVAVEGTQLFGTAQDFNHMPRTQWVVEQNQGVAGEQTVNITNREFPQFTYKNVQLYKAGENIYAEMGRFAGDTLSVTAVDKKYTSDPNLGYKKFTAAEAYEKFYNLDYLSGIQLGNYVNIKGDSSIYVDLKGGKTYIEFVPVYEYSKYGYASEVAGATQLYRQAYYLRLNDETLLTSSNYYIVESEDGQSYEISAETSGREKIPFLLKEQNQLVSAEKDTTCYYALQAVSPYYDENTEKYYVNNNAKCTRRVGVRDASLTFSREDAWYHTDKEVRIATFAVVKDATPLYRRLGVSKADDGLKDLDVQNAKIYRINATEKEYLYEDANSVYAKDKGINFLGVEGKGDSKLSALYVDTAYVRNETNMPQYMFAVDVTEVPAGKWCPDNDEHNTPEYIANHGDCGHKVDTEAYKIGRYLINAEDSVVASVNSKNYVWNTKYTRLAFVQAKHIGDTLVIYRDGKPSTLPADSIFLGDNLHNINFADGASLPAGANAMHKAHKNGIKNAVFALRLVNADDCDFLIESVGDHKIPSDGFGKWVAVKNGVPVVAAYQTYTDAIYDAEIFNIEPTTEEATANEAIAAEGVQVIGGKGAVTVQGAAGKVITVADILGRTIANQVAASDNVTIAAPAGVVVVAVEGDATKVVVK